MKIIKIITKNTKIHQQLISMNNCNNKNNYNKVIIIFKKNKL